MKSRIPHRWMVNVDEGDLVRNTVYITKRAATRVADRAREAGFAATVSFRTAVA